MKRLLLRNRPAIAFHHYPFCCGIDCGGPGMADNVANADVGSGNVCAGYIQCCTHRVYKMIDRSVVLFFDLTAVWA